MQAHAEGAAEAVGAAGAPGKFCEMHHVLYEHQSAPLADNLGVQAAMVGVSPSRFIREMNERRYPPKVRDEFMSGARSGVNGTPPFFVNGFRHDGPWDLGSLLAAVNRAVGTTDVLGTVSAGKLTHR